MKKFLVVAAAVAGIAGGVYAGDGHDHGKEGHKHEAADTAAASVTVTGEVIDLNCYLSGGEMGKDHAKCAKACLTNKGAAAGLLTKEGKLFLLVAPHGGEKAFKKACELGGEQAKVTGKKADKGGLQAILVEKVEKV